VESANSELQHAMSAAGSKSGNRIKAGKTGRDAPGHNPKWFAVPYTRGRVAQIAGEQLFDHFALPGDTTLIGDGHLDALVIGGSEIPDTNTPDDWWRVVKDGGHIAFIGVDADDALNNAELWPAWTCVEHEEGLLVLRKGGHGHNYEPFRKRDLSCLVIRYGAWGDQIMAASVLPHLKWEGWHITLNCQAPQDEINRTNPYVDDFMVQDRGQVHPDSLIDYWRALETRYERVVNLSSSVEGQALLTPSHPTYYYDHEARKRLFNKNYLELTHDIVGVPHDFDGARFYATAEETARAAQIKKEIGRPLVAWVLTGSSVHKFHPGQHKAIVRLLHATDAAIMLMGDKDSIPVQDLILEDVEAYHGDTTRILAQVGKFQMRASMAMAQAADVVIGPETGLLNAVGMEANRKVILISHSGAGQLTKHWKNTTELLPENTPCFPCHRMHFGFDYCTKDEKTHAALCQANISVDRIVEAVSNGLH
jgi:ADP-heptose:LPS heptosyltransferase